MAKVQIKSEQITPFGGIFSIMEQFDALLSKVIDSTLGKCCQPFGYSYSEFSNQREQSLKLSRMICRVQTRLFKYFVL